MLVYGYGNPGRLDDGLGPALVRELVARGLDSVATFEASYQVQVEDAALIAQHHLVVFVDADAGCAAPFALRRIAPHDAASFSTHSVAPETVLALAHTHFNARVEGFVLGIRGYDFDGFGEQLSPGARRNLAAAADHISSALQGAGLVLDLFPAQPEGGSHVRG